MKKIFVFLIGLLFIASFSFADPGDFSVQRVLNRVLDTTNNALNATITGSADMGKITADAISIDGVTGVDPFRVMSVDAVGDVPVFIVDKNNNVGIGTGTPTVSLDVIGSVSIDAYNNTPPLSVVSTDGGSIFIVTPDKNVFFNKNTMVGTGFSRVQITTTKSGNDGNLLLYDDTASSLGVGGQLTFWGNFTGTTPTIGSRIQAEKSDNTAGNFGFDTVIYSRMNGVGDIGDSEMLRIGEVETVINNDSNDTDTRIESNFKASGLVVSSDTTSSDEAVYSEIVAIKFPNLKRGATQADASALPGDLWADTDDGMTIKIGT